MLVKIDMAMRLPPVTLLFTLIMQTVAEVKVALNYAALGDSYAAGDGAGSSRLLPRFDLTCGRFSEAYPVQVANSTEIAISQYGFQNLACGGASSLSMLYSQIPKLDDADIVTITVGGNEVDFFALLNACVHQWWPSESCEKEMGKARALVQSATFLNKFNKMVAQTKSAIEPDTQLFITGYAAFFNGETRQCNDVGFSRRDPSNVLTNELRKSFNQMVSMLNDVIRAATEAHDATYVDINRLFEGHRFCEEGVVEPSDRSGTWFFNIDLNQAEPEYLETDSSAQNLLPRPIKDFFDMTKTFHPTGLGHQAIAKEIVGLARSKAG